MADLVWMFTARDGECDQTIASEVHCLTNYPLQSLVASTDQIRGPVTNEEKRALVRTLEPYMTTMNRGKEEEQEEISQATKATSRKSKATGLYEYMKSGAPLHPLDFADEYCNYIESRRKRRGEAVRANAWFRGICKRCAVHPHRSPLQVRPNAQAAWAVSSIAQPMASNAPSGTEGCSKAARSRKTLSPGQIRRLVAENASEPQELQASPLKPPTMPPTPPPCVVDVASVPSLSLDVANVRIATAKRDEKLSEAKSCLFAAWQAALEKYHAAVQEADQEFTAHMQSQTPESEPRPEADAHSTMA